MSKNIVIYTIFKSRQNGPGELRAGEGARGAKDTVMSWTTREDAANAMFTQAKNLERDGYIRVLRTETPDPEGVFHAAVDFEQHGIAHNWNQGEVIRACRDCPDVPVIVANTFRQTFELKPYFDIAKMFNRGIFVFTLRTEHDNIHGVPDKKVEQMRLGMQPFRWEEWGPYPFPYYCDIMTDDEAAKIAQMVHIKYFQRH